MAPVSGVKRTIDVLELLVHAEDPLTLGEIASGTGIPTASCHAIMHTLADEGYVTRRTEGRAQYWEPTLALYHLGATLVARYGIRDIALPHLRELSASFGVPAHIGVLDGENVIYLEKAAAPSFIQFDTYPGKRSGFGITALGRAIAAHLPEEERSALLAGQDARLAAQLDEARERGYALEDSEDIDGVGCIAAPIYGARGDVVASVGITGFSRDLFPGGEIPAVPVVLETAREISAALGFRAASKQPA